MSEKIKQILAEHPNLPYEIHFRPQRYCHASEVQLLYTPESGLVSGLREDIDIHELWADGYSIMGEDDYNRDVAELGCMTFEDLHGDANAEVLVIWASSLTYDILCDPSTQTVREVYKDNLGAFNDYLVTKRMKEKSTDYSEYDYDEDDYDEDDRGSVTKLEAVVRTKTKLDKMFVEEYEIVGEERFYDRYELSGFGEDAWWERESFEEHFGKPDAHLLIIILK